MPQKKWTEAEKAEVAKLWLTTPITCKKLGEQFGVSKNSIAGLIHRLDIHRFNKEDHKNRNEKMKVRRLEPRHPKLTNKNVKPVKVPLLQVKDGQCRWPMWGEDKNYVVCGNECRPKATYCKVHERQSFRKNYPSAERDAFLLQSVTSPISQ